jgi:hypothetical protein
MEREEKCDEKKRDREDCVEGYEIHCGCCNNGYCEVNGGD